MSENKKFEERDEALESLVGWMEDLDGATPEQLRSIRRDLGHDVEGSERQFLAMLEVKSREAGIELLSGAAAEGRARLNGILRAAKEQGFLNTQQFADSIGLSPVLVTMLDRGLLSNIPQAILTRVASAVRCSVEVLTQYLKLGPRLATGASYKADEVPATEESQDFFEAVLDDPTISDERREEIMALKDE